MLVEDFVFSGDVVRNVSFFALTSIEHLGSSIASPKQLSSELLT